MCTKPFMVLLNTIFTAILFIAQTIQLQSCLLVSSQPQTPCSQTYFNEWDCEADDYCRWNPRSSACASVCAGLDAVECGRKSKCSWDYKEMRCDYTMTPTKKPSRVPTKTPSKNPIIPPSTVIACSTINSQAICATLDDCVWYSFLPSNQCRVPCALGTKETCNMARYCIWNGVDCINTLIPPTTRSPVVPSSKKPTLKPTPKPTIFNPTPKPTSGNHPSTPHAQTKLPTKKPTIKNAPTSLPPPTGKPSQLNFGDTYAPTSKPVPNENCIKIKDASTCTTSGCIWITVFKRCQQECSYLLATACQAAAPCMWLNGKCQFKTDSPSAAPTTFFPTPPTTFQPTTLGVPIYMNVYIPKNTKGPEGQSIWDYMRDVMATRLRIDDKRNIYIRLCGSSAFRDDLPAIDRVNGSPECAMYEMVGNKDDYSDNLRVNSAKMLINIYGQAYLESGIQAEFYYKRLLIIMTELLKPLNGYVQDYHPPVTKAMKKPNIVFMVADDLGYGDVGYQACSGPSTKDKLCTPKEITPNIDAIANHQNTVVFDRFYAYSSCGPSRVSIISGREPGRDCILENPGGFGDPPNIPTNLFTLPEAAKLAGYKTYHVGKWHVGTMFGDNLSQTAHPGQIGYDEWYATPKWTATKNLNCGCFDAKKENLCDTGMYTTDYFLYEYADLDRDGNRKFLVKNNIYRFPCANYYYVNKEQPFFNVQNENTGGWPTPLLGDDSNYVVDRFSKFLDKHDKKDPFFAALWFHNPHAPFISSNDEFRAKADELIQKDAGKNWCGELFDSYNDNQLGRKTCRQKYGDAYCNNLCLTVKREYYSSILQMDANIGKIMNLLDKHDLRQNTMVIFISDNGPARYDTTGNGNRYIGPGSTSGLPGYKFDMREGGLRVPAFIYFPGAVTRNMHISSPVGIVDILPTVIELAGDNRPFLQKMSRFQLDGTSLLPYIRGYDTIKRTKPLGFVNLKGYQYLIFNDIALRRSPGSSNIMFYNIAGSGLTDDVEKVTKTMKSTDTSDDIIQRYKGWATSYSGSTCISFN